MKIGDLPAIRFAMGIESFNFFPLLRVEGMLMAPYRLLWSGHHGWLSFRCGSVVHRSQLEAKGREMDEFESAGWLAPTVEDEGPEERYLGLGDEERECFELPFD